MQIRHLHSIIYPKLNILPEVNDYFDHCIIELCEIYDNY